MVKELLALPLSGDLLFLDDNSPDGTGELLDSLATEHTRLSVIHRSGKLGVGSAHIDGINWAYDHGYERLITLDCDFTHSPRDVQRLLEQSEGYDLTIGSRYVEANSLPGWNPLRRALTGFGHILTTKLLRIPFDATGALRIYDLRVIPRELFNSIRARGYGFFFESMFACLQNKVRVKEVPIVLPARTYGHSKMSLKETMRSGFQLLDLWVGSVVSPARYRSKTASQPVLNDDLHDPQNWDAYWGEKRTSSNRAYDLLAEAYRTQVIRRRLEKEIFKTFANGSLLLHAGCGSGQVDERLHERMRIMAIDISPAALRLYQANNPFAQSVRHADLLKLPFPSNTFDGAYNLGVMEHFTEDEITQILRELQRVIKPGGKLLLFWPHARATSVAVLKTAHWMMNDVLGRTIRLHPPEVSLMKGKDWAARELRSGGFELRSFQFGAADFWVQAVIVADRQPGAD